MRLEIFARPPPEFLIREGASRSGRGVEPPRPGIGFQGDPQKPGVRAKGRADRMDVVDVGRGGRRQEEKDREPEDPPHGASPALRKRSSWRRAVSTEVGSRQVWIVCR